MAGKREGLSDGRSLGLEVREEKAREKRSPWGI